MGLPRGFGTTLETIPARVPYFTADPDAVGGCGGASASAARCGSDWCGRAASAITSGAFSIGGREEHDAPQLGPLAGVRDVVFYSLQKGEAARKAARPPPGMRLVDLAGELGDFADSAALIEALDLVISVDTAAVHVAGALGKPVWNLVKISRLLAWSAAARIRPGT